MSSYSISWSTMFTTKRRFAMQHSTGYSNHLSLEVAAFISGDLLASFPNNLNSIT